MAVAAHAQTDAFQGFCNRGGQFAVVSNLNSSNRLQNVIPSCTVTVYYTGTTTAVPANLITKDKIGTPLGNPFTADATTSLTPGHWLFFAADGQGYDVIGSGGIAPNAYPSPVPLGIDLIINAGGGSGGCTTGGAAGQFLVTNGSGGCTVTAVQVNNTPLTAPSPVNFVNSSTVIFTNPSVGQISATASAPLQAILQHNDVNLTGLFAANPFTIDFDDTTPTPPAGKVNVTFQPDPATGRISAYVPSTAIPSFDMEVVPPISGQFAVVYPTTGAISTDPPGLSNIFANGTSAAGGNFTWKCSGLLCSIAGNVQANWSGFTLPSYINPANVTAIYSDAITSSGSVNIPPVVFTDSFSGTGVSCAGAGSLMVSSSSYPYNFTETTQLTSLTGTNFNSSAQCSIQVGGSGPGAHGQNVVVSAIRYLVYYTGTPPPTDTALHLGQYLSQNIKTNTLFDDNPYPYANVLLPSFVANLPPAAANSGSFITVQDGTDTENCTTGGGVSHVLCYSNGTTWIAYGASYLTTIGTAGPATLSNGILNIPVYSSGGGDTITSPKGTIAVGGTSTNTTLDFTKTPSAATATATTPGQMIYDTTNGNEHFNVSSTDLIMAGFPSASLPTSGHCAQFTEIGAWWEITDAGAACGSGGGFTAGQDLAGTSTAQEVVGILNHALPALTTGYPNWNGSAWVFSTPSGAIANQTAGYAVEADSATTAATRAFPIDDAVTTAATLTAHKALAVNDGSGNAGYVNLLGATSNASVVANTVGFMAPSSASFTAYALQLPATGPTTSLPLLSCATPTSGVSPCTFVANAGGSGTVNSGTAGQFTYYAATGTVVSGNTHLSDNGTNVASTEPITAPTVLAGSPSTAAQSALPTGAKGWSCDETSTAGVPAAGVDYLRCDSVNHQMVQSFNGAAEALFGGTSPPIYDDFTRANATFTTPWALEAGATSVLPSINTNLASCSNGSLGCIAYYSAVITANQYVEVPLTTLPTGNGGVDFRITPSTTTYYACIYIAGTGVRFYKIISGAGGVQIGGTYSTSISAGAVLGVRAVGTILTAYINGAPVLQVVDNSITTGNYAGIQIGDTTARFGPFVAYAL